MIYGADKDDPATFLAATGDGPSHVEWRLSPAELDAFLLAAISHIRQQGRDVTLSERFLSDEPADG